MTSKLMNLVGIDIRFGMQSALHRKFSGRDKLLDATPSNEVKDHREKLQMVMDSSVQIEIMAWVLKKNVSFQHGMDKNVSWHLLVSLDACLGASVRECVGYASLVFP